MVGGDSGRYGSYLTGHTLSKMVCCDGDLGSLPHTASPSAPNMSSDHRGSREDPVSLALLQLPNATPPVCPSSCPYHYSPSRSFLGQCHISVKLIREQDVQSQMCQMVLEEV